MNTAYTLPAESLEHLLRLTASGSRIAHNLSIEDPHDPHVYREMLADAQQLLYYLEDIQRQLLMVKRDSAPNPQQSATVPQG